MSCKNAGEESASQCTFGEKNAFFARYESECCGFGGTFAVKHADISGAMVADKSKNLVASDVVRYVSADHGCMMNINGALDYQKQPLRGEHIATYLLNRIKGQSSKASL